MTKQINLNGLKKISLFKSYPLITRFFIFIFFPLLIVLVFGAIYLLDSLPNNSGELVSKQVRERVSISRDRQGVTYIKGQNDLDVFFALGFAHAQDRMWQLELQRRLAKGQLSEVFGKLEIPQDVWLRTLGLYEAAEISWALLSDEAKKSLSSYKNGINAWLNTKPTLPVEFTILGIQPKPWTEIDSLVWVKLFALDMANNMWREGMNFIASQILDDAQMADFFNIYPEDSEITLTKMELKSSEVLSNFPGIKEKIEGKWKIGGKFVGSNAWVISGKYTDNGQAVLANDPHLALQLPSLWYVADLQGESINVSGMTLVGLPVVIFGRNKDIAWAGTSMMADVQDLYFEQVNTANPKQYKHKNEWREFDSRVETINVKADFPAGLRPKVEPVDILVRNSVNGPIISDVHHFYEQAVALKWTALDKDDVSYEAFFKLNYASDWNSFRQALRYCSAPALNMLYIDKENNIGYQAVGKIPIRKTGIGNFPVAAWKDIYSWTGYIPYDELPSVFNPDKGYIVSANNKITNSKYPYFISNDWMEPARADRIDQLIQNKIKNKEPLSLDYMKDMQSDNLDLSLTKLLGIMKETQPTSEMESQALSYIVNWNGWMGPESQAASIFYAWAKNLRKELFWDEFEGYWNKQSHKNSLSNIVNSTTYDQLFYALSNPQFGWCDNVSTELKETCPAIISYALKRSLSELEKLYGKDMSEWSWGNVHKTIYVHLPFSFVNILDLFFERRLQGGGSMNSINVGNAVFNETQGYQKNFGAGFRQVIQMDKEHSGHYFMNSTGQSGNVMSKYYDNMIIPFRDFDYFRILKEHEIELDSVFYIKPEEPGWEDEV